MSPIRASEKDRYPKDWPAISQRIREREGNCCKWCGAPNGEFIERDSSGNWHLHSHTGVCMGEACDSVKIVLTVAHLDHTPEHCEDDNLAALCQRCHNRYDAPMRRQGRRDRSPQLDLISPRPARTGIRRSSSLTARGGGATTTDNSQ